MSKTINYKQAQAELITLGDWLRFVASSVERSQVFLGHGNDNAWDEAVQLVMGVLNVPIESDNQVFHARLLSEEREELVKALQLRIEKRMPTAYITHQAYCLGMPFYVDERVLIPRSPFAEWIDKRFQPWVDPESVYSILEIGTGSGCLAVATAMAFPEAYVCAVDINPDALAVAKQNILRYGLEGQVDLIESNCFSALSNKKFDLIFSNPPYVGASEMASLPAEYQHEPHAALFAEDEGLLIVNEILRKAASHLTDNGVLLVEVGNTQALLEERMPEVPFTWLEQDQGGHGIFMLTKEQLERVNVRK